LARDAQAKLALIVAQCLSIHLSVCVSVRDSLSHAYVRSIARREPRRLPACALIYLAYLHSPQFLALDRISSQAADLNRTSVSMEWSWPQWRRNLAWFGDGR